MGINPSSLLKLKGAKDKFEASHPKMVSFLKTTFGGDIPEGTVIEISVTKPGEKPVVSNMKVKEADLELFGELKEIITP